MLQNQIVDSFHIVDQIEVLFSKYWCVMGQIIAVEEFVFAPAGVSEAVSKGCGSAGGRLGKLATLRDASCCAEVVVRLSVSDVVKSIDIWLEVHLLRNIDLLQVDHG